MNRGDAGETPQSIGRGIFWMCSSMLLFVCMDGLTKHLIRTYPVAEVIWVRFVFHLVFMLPLMARRLPVLAKTRSLGLQMLRGAMVNLSNVAIIIALQYLPLTEVSVLGSVSPLIVTALSVPLLGEKVGLRRWVGVTIGFVGVVLVVRPGGDLIHWAAIFPLLGSISYAINQIATRRLGRIDHPLTTVFYTALFGVACTSVAVPFLWVAPDMTGWLLMAGVGLLSLGGHILTVRAFQVAPAAVVAPFNYSALVWATVVGYVAFGDLPDGWTMVGATVIVASGLYVLDRQRKKNRPEGTPE
jgi:drug/metabolite transporter (DMT)-like permease